MSTGIGTAWFFSFFFSFFPPFLTVILLSCILVLTFTAYVEGVEWSGDVKIGGVIVFLISIFSWPTQKKERKEKEKLSSANNRVFPQVCGARAEERCRKSGVGDPRHRPRDIAGTNTHRVWL